MQQRSFPEADGTPVAVVAPVTAAHLDGVMNLFAQAWWTRDRSREQVAAMLDSTPATTGLLNPRGELVAFARAISDFEFKALIVDVIVGELERNRGHGRLVVRELLRHPALVRVEDFELYCDRDLIPYYERLGFSEPTRTHFMRRSGG